MITIVMFLKIETIPFLALILTLYVDIYIVQMLIEAFA